MSREQFLSSQARELDRVFSLTSGEEESRKRFERLTLDTYESLASVGMTIVIPFSARSEIPHNFLGPRWINELPTSLLRRWEDWSKEYRQIVARNPRLELKDMMHDISESYMSSSWPVDYEDVIQDWVDAGDPTASRFFVTPETGTPDFYHRLRELRQLCGGWLYWDSELKEVVFAPEPEWQKIRAARKAHKAEEWKQQQQSTQLAQLVKSAIADPTFWERFKDRELEPELIRRGERNEPLSPSMEELVTELVRRLFPEDHHVPIDEAIHRLRSKARAQLGGRTIQVRASPTARS